MHWVRSLMRRRRGMIILLSLYDLLSFLLISSLIVLLLAEYSDIGMTDFVWVEKYRPKKIEDCILPNSIKNQFKAFLATGQISNMLLHGTAGVGKTTVARALCEELKVDYIIINGSD